MVDPQAENGHIDIANEIAEHFCRYRISGEEWLVLWAIVRKTYGWKKKEDRISLSQFSLMTGLKRQTALRAINKLSSKKIIGVIKNDDSGINIYSFNKYFDEWVLSSKKITVSSKKIMPVIKKDNGVSSKKGHTKDTLTKDTLTKEIIPPTPMSKIDIPEWVPREAWDGFIVMRREIKKPLTGRAIQLAINKLQGLKNQGHDPGEVLDQSTLGKWQGLYELKNPSNPVQKFRGAMDWAERKKKELEDQERVKNGIQ